MEREQTTIRLPKDLKEEIQKRADEEYQSFNTKAIILLRKGLEAELVHAEIRSDQRRY